LKVLIDLDGVVLDMCGAIAAKVPGFNPDLVTDYNFKCPCGAEYRDIKKALCSLSTFEVQNPYKGAIAGIRKLINAGVEPYAYTEVAPHILSYRNIQIKMLNLLGEAYLLGDKPVNLDGYAAVFEDNPANLKQWTNGITKYIIDRPYNKRYSGALRFADLSISVDHFLRNVLTKNE